MNITLLTDARLQLLSKFKNQVVDRAHAAKLYTSPTLSKMLVLTVIINFSL